MKRIACFLILIISFLYARPQFTVSTNGHYLVRDGKPFFWLGDTGWELFHRLTREQATQYLTRRSEQGFTIIQAVALAEFDGLHTPNAYGALPLKNDDPAQPDTAYFRHVDFIIDKAAELGLAIGFLPTWGDKISKLQWGTGPEIFTPENAKVYGQWLGNRYKNRKNIIWILGGDRNPQNEVQLEIWRQMAAGIILGVGGKNKPIISYHPQPNQLGSGEWFFNDDWFTFNMFQNGHCRDVAVYDKIQASYNRMPVKPVLDAEPIYEDHPVCFNAKDLGTSSAYDIRKYAYLDLFAGACGHTYGCHDIWQFYSKERPGVNGPHIYWEQALELPGANQMIFIRKLLESRPLLERVPDQSLVAENDLTPAERIQATRGKDYLFVYTAAGKPFTINMGKITGKTLNAYWFNPRDGKFTPIPGKIENLTIKRFAPPETGYGKDWVLVLDDASKNYPVN